MVSVNIDMHDQDEFHLRCKYDENLGKIDQESYCWDSLNKLMNLMNGKNIARAHAEFTPQHEIDDIGANILRHCLRIQICPAVLPLSLHYFTLSLHIAFNYENAHHLP